MARPGTPWVGATLCTLPFGSRINSAPSPTTRSRLPTSISQATSSPTRSTSAGRTSATARPPGNPNCNPDPPDVGAASQSVSRSSRPRPPRRSTTRPRGRDLRAGGLDRSRLPSPSTWRGNPPTGTVTFDWFTNSTCIGGPTATSSALASPAAASTRRAFPQGPLAAGLYGFKAHYVGRRPGLHGSTARASRSVSSTRTSRSRRHGTNRIGGPHLHGSRERERRHRPP